MSWLIIHVWLGFVYLLMTDIIHLWCRIVCIMLWSMWTAVISCITFKSSGSLKNRMRRKFFASPSTVYFNPVFCFSYFPASFIDSAPFWNHLFSMVFSSCPAVLQCVFNGVNERFWCWQVLCCWDSCGSFLPAQQRHYIQVQDTDEYCMCLHKTYVTVN